MKKNELEAKKIISEINDKNANRKIYSSVSDFKENWIKDLEK